MTGYQIHLCLDWGTSKWVASYAIYHGATCCTRPQVLRINDTSNEVPMAATWINGQLVQGHALEGWADQDAEISDRVMELFKLPLYHSQQTQDVAQRVERTLQQYGKTHEDLIADHLKAIMKDIKLALEGVDDQFVVTRTEWKHMINAMNIRITVPEMWEPGARRTMQAAARRAGLDTVTLASEPQCALAYLMDRFDTKKMKMARSFDQGDKILVIDLGCGTGDWVCYELLDQLGPNSRLKAVGNASGELCGSFAVDEILYKTLISRMGDEWRLQSIVDLGVRSEQDFQRRALAAVDHLKCNIGRRNCISTTIQGIAGKHVPIDLSRNEVQQAFDAVLEHIYAATDKFVKHRGTCPSMMQVTGGFAKSAYLMKRMRERYPDIPVIRPNDNDTAECFPVAHGGLLRYGDIVTSHLPSRYGYAMLQRQEADPDVHLDSFRWNSDDELEPVESRVQPSPYDENVMVVDDRIVNILAIGQIIVPDRTYRMIDHEEIFFVEMKDPVISAQFVYLTKGFNNDDSARLVPSGREHVGKFKKGVHPWADVRIPLEKQELLAHGFPVVKANDGTRHWRLQARATVRLRYQDLVIGFDILKRPTKEDGHKPKVAFSVMDTVWDSKHSEFLE